MKNQIHQVVLILQLIGIAMCCTPRDATAGSSFLDGFRDPKNYRVKDLNMRAGDVISCYINGVAKHIMLATDSRNVIHIRNSGDSAYITESSVDSLDDQNCRVDTSRVDRLMLPIARPYSGSEAVSRARQSGRDYSHSFHYNLLTCNCEHWVNYWRYGVAISFQSLPSSASCPI